MFKKSIISLLCFALIFGSVDYKVYAEEIILEETQFEETEPENTVEETISEEPIYEDGISEDSIPEENDIEEEYDSDVNGDAELAVDDAYITSFSIKDIPAGKSETDPKKINTLKLGHGVIAEYKITLSSGKAAIYPLYEIENADDNDIIVELSSSVVSVLGINDKNNSVWGWKIGESRLTATAYLKKDKDNVEKHFTATKDINVCFPQGEIIEYFDGRKIISFDGTAEYSGWVKPLRNNIYSASNTLEMGGSYFITEGDYFDCPLSEDPSGRKSVEMKDIGSMAENCALWIKDGDIYRLYKFDEKGVIMKNDAWHRLKGISVNGDTTSFTEGEKYTFVVNYTSEDTEGDLVNPVNINDDKSVRVTSSNPEKVKVGDVTYEYDKNYRGEKSIVSCTFDLYAISAGGSGIDITVISGDDDNKYLTDNTKTVTVSTGFPIGFKMIGGKVFYVKDSAGNFHEGWYPSSSNRKLYFYTSDDATSGFGTIYSMATGLSMIKNGSGTTDYYLFDEDGNYIGESKGWQTIDGKKYYFHDKNNMAVGFETIDGKNYLFDENGCQLFNGLYTVLTETFYVDKSGNVLTGWRTVNKHKYYFDPQTGAMCTGDVVIGDKGYHLWEDDTADHYKGQAATGYVEISGNKYYYDANAVMKTGWQKIKDGTGTNWHYFAKGTGSEIAPDPVTQEGKSFWRTITENGITVDYYFPNNGTPYVAKKDGSGKVIKTGMVITNAGKSYYVDEKGNVVHGWMKLTIDGNTDWFFFSTGDGQMTDPSSVTTTVDADGKSKWRTTGSMTFYFPQDKSVAKGFKDIKDAAGTKYRYYFESNIGKMEKGTFDVGKDTYYANAEGRLLLNSWNSENDKFFNSSGKMVKGFYTINKKTYYFYENGGPDYGKMATGRVTVKGKDYLLNENDGVLLKNYYGTGILNPSADYYFTNSAGVLLNSWQKVKVEGVTDWHYFNEGTHSEINASSITVTDGADGKSKWRRVNGNTYYFPNNSSLAKGFKDIKDEYGVKHTYYFDKTSGKLLSGKITVGSSNYYLNDDGEKMTSGFVKVNGNYIYLNKSGVVSKKWFTVDKKKYYGDPITGNLAVGFEKIGKEMYYFNETEATIGMMQTGFFTVPNIGQEYYDAGGSNIYYAESNGALAKSGWKNIKENTSARDAQIWSYYLNPNVCGYTKKGDLIYGEVVTGDVVIKDNGIVIKYVSGDPGDAGDITRMYSFDKNTGARKKAVLYFHGGAYTESLMSVDQRAQLNTMLSIATYMNTDRKLSTPSDMMILAGYSDLSAYGITSSGNGFPIAACKAVKAEEELYNPAFDVVKYDADNDSYVSGSDESVDIGDIEVYSFNLYKDVINKFGPNNVVLMGASSGGAIALSILEKASKAEVYQPSETILYSPWLDATMDNPKAKRYSSRGVDYGMLLARGARVTRDVTYNNGNPYGRVTGAAGPGAHSKAAWFASPILESNGCAFTGVKNITIYEGTNDPCYPDVSAFVSKHKGMVTMKTTSAGHGYMFDNGGSTVLNTSKAIMTQKGVK